MIEKLDTIIEMNASYIEALEEIAQELIDWDVENL